MRAICKRDGIKAGCSDEFEFHLDIFEFELEFALKYEQVLQLSMGAKTILQQKFADLQCQARHHWTLARRARPAHCILESPIGRRRLFCTHIWTC